MARKTFNDCKSGDELYLLDLSNNLELMVKKLDVKSYKYGRSSFTVRFRNAPDYAVHHCIGGRSRCNNLFTTEEEALMYKQLIEDGHPVFKNVSIGDIVFVVEDKTFELRRCPITIVEEHGFSIGIGNNSSLVRTEWEELNNKIRVNDWRNHMVYSLFLVEADARRCIREAERRRERVAVDKYMKKIENYDGKPIEHKDNLGAELHYGDTVAYIRRIGINGHPQLRKGIIVGESKTKITVFDEDEKKNGKPTGWQGRRIEESDGRHMLEPQSILLMKLAEVNKKSGFSFKH